jgi:BASS family bile acid:Na+ symporter
LEINPLLFVAQTTLLLVLPLAVGMLLAAKAPEFAANLRGKMTLIGSSVLGGIIVYGSFHFHALLLPAVGLFGSVTILHNTAAFITGAVVSRLLSRQRAVRRAITFEVGIQNSGLVLIILLGQLKGMGGAAAIAAVWGGLAFDRRWDLSFCIPYLR